MCHPLVSSFHFSSLCSLSEHYPPLRGRCHLEYRFGMIHSFYCNFSFLSNILFQNVSSLFAEVIFGILHSMVQFSYLFYLLSKSLSDSIIFPSSSSNIPLRKVSSTSVRCHMEYLLGMIQPLFFNKCLHYFLILSRFIQTFLFISLLEYQSQTNMDSET